MSWIYEAPSALPLPISIPRRSMARNRISEMPIEIGVGGNYHRNGKLRHPRNERARERPDACLTSGNVMDVSAGVGLERFWHGSQIKERERERERAWNAHALRRRTKLWSRNCVNRARYVIHAIPAPQIYTAKYRVLESRKG